MQGQAPPHSQKRWLGQFILYFLLFTLLVSAGVYFFRGSDETPTIQPTTAEEATPKPAAPAGLAGHDAPRPAK